MVRAASTILQAFLPAWVATYGVKLIGAHAAGIRISMNSHRLIFMDLVSCVSSQADACIPIYVCVLPSPSNGDEQTQPLGFMFPDRPAA